jgi:hypothetical protein
MMQSNQEQPAWPEHPIEPAVQGEISLGDGHGHPTSGQEPIVRLVIDLYSLDRLVTVKYHVPKGSELETELARGPAQAEGWKRLVDTLKRNLDEIVEIHERQWWTPDQARFTVGERVRLVEHPNFPVGATGRVAASPGPRRVRPGVLYRVWFDTPQVNRHNGEPYHEADVLEEHLQPLSGR